MALALLITSTSITLLAVDTANTYTTISIRLGIFTSQHSTESNSRRIP